jgi:hypothetical protein
MPSRQKRLYERLSIDEKAVVIDEKFDDRPMVFIDEKVDDYHVFWRHLLDEKAGIDAKSSILVESFVTLDTIKGHENARGVRYRVRQVPPAGGVFISNVPLVPSRPAPHSRERLKHPLSLQLGVHRRHRGVVVRALVRVVGVLVGHAVHTFLHRGLLGTLPRDPTSLRVGSLAAESYIRLRLGVDVLVALPVGHAHAPLRVGVVRGELLLPVGIVRVVVDVVRVVLCI